MDPVAQFARTYGEARNKFHAAVRARHLHIETHALPALRGVDDEALATDVALLGARDAAGMLVLTSGTHGIEGYCGSGCQVGLLLDQTFIAAVKDSGVAVLFVHALNPHGFAHGRRVNEDNVDLNRNFRDFSQPLPTNTAYAEVHPWLVPATWPPPAANEMQIGAYIQARGQSAFQAAVTGGQHEFADGMFFGGRRATWSNRMLHGVLRAHGLRRRRIGWIDFHTGLGPRGHGEKIHAGRNLDADLARARRWWGGEVTSIHDGSSTSALVTGIITGAAFDECPGAEITAMALEYGTVPLVETLAALRADHWLHNHPEAPPEQRVAIRAAMRAAFYDEADDWKLKVYSQAQQSALQALTRLAHH